MSAPASVVCQSAERGWAESDLTFMMDNAGYASSTAQARARSRRSRSAFACSYACHSARASQVAALVSSARTAWPFGSWRTALVVGGQDSSADWLAPLRSTLARRDPATGHPSGRSEEHTSAL